MTTPHANSPHLTSNNDPDGDTFGSFLSDPMPTRQEAIDIMHSLFPPNQLIEGRQIRDLYELRDFVDACIDAAGNVALDVPMDMRLMQKILPGTGKEVYDLEVTRW